MKEKETELEKYVGVVAGSIPQPVVVPPETPYDPADDARIHWPKGKKTPTVYRRPTTIPCVKCLRLRTDDLGRAVMLTATRDRMAYFRCKACQHTFKLPLKKD